MQSDEPLSEEDVDALLDTGHPMDGAIGRLWNARSALLATIKRDRERIAELEAERDALKEEVERLRDIISPGDAAAYEEGMAAQAALLDRARDVLKWLLDEELECEASRDAAAALLKDMEKPDAS